MLFRHQSFKRRLKEQLTETKTVGKGGVFRLDRNHMKEASEEELGLNLTVQRVGAGRRPLRRTDGSWLLGQPQGLAVALWDGRL